MKTNLKLILPALSIFAVFACKNNNSQDDESATEEVQTETISVENVDSRFADDLTGTIYEDYLLMSKALFNDDVETVNKAAKDIADNMEDKLPDLKAVAVKLSTSRDIKKQRKLFSEFSNAAGELFSENLEEGTIYQQFCPMAFNGAGAYWYSEQKDIQNPYFGEEMPICGSTKQTINPKENDEEEVSNE